MDNYQPGDMTSKPNPDTPPGGHMAPGTPPATGGPAPLPPQPEPPRISAAELALLTEAAATKNGTFQCTLCSKQFGYKNGLIRHVRLTHVGEKPYQCNICNRRFGYKHILMEHQNLHFGNRPYACNMCDKKFAARSNLIQHRMVHKRPFHCTLCNKRFDREDQLKKHLFAHPQSLLCCSICKYTAASQKDLNNHMTDAHPSPPPAPPPQTSPMTQHTPPTPEPKTPDIRPPIHYNHNGLSHPELARTEPITPPDSAEEQSMAMTPPSSLPQTRLPPMPPHGLPLDHRGFRIDTICSQLSNTMNTMSSHYGGPPPPPPGLPPNLYHGVIVKKEMSDEELAHLPLPQHDDRPPQSPESPRSDVDPHNRSGLQPGPPYLGPPYSQVSSSSSPEPPHSAPTPLSSHPPYLSPSRPSLTPDSLGTRPFDDKPLSALPGIHEVFSRRGGLGAKLPSFAGSLGLPGLFPSESRLPSMSHSDLSPSPPPPTTAATNSVQPLTQCTRPTAQLPPITQVLHQSRDKATQHSAPIPGFPALDDVLSYYIGQGMLFKCHYCNIVFFERGMYFLHASLHGASSPWECSICHTVCADKNEFTIHFVNQQHHT